MNKTVYITVGHTAAGKTTLSRMLSAFLGIEHISEGEIKRSLKSNYQSTDSLNESLRDQGYAIAINRMVEKLNVSSSVVLDASFHKKYRRIWVYKALEVFEDCSISVIWTYCNCPDKNIVKNRIANRKNSLLKHADNQADIFEIYEHISSTFDVPSISEFPSQIPSAIIKINTLSNNIEYVERSDNFDNSIIERLLDSFFPEYFLKMKAN